jgi:hypothetical protein
VKASRNILDDHVTLQRDEFIFGGWNETQGASSIDFTAVVIT